MARCFHSHYHGCVQAFPDDVNMWRPREGYVKITNKDTVGDLMDVIEEKLGVPPHRQRLFYKYYRYHIHTHTYTLSKQAVLAAPAATQRMAVPLGSTTWQLIDIVCL